MIDIEFQKITKYSGNFDKFLNIKQLRKVDSVQDKKIDKIEKLSLPQMPPKSNFKLISFPISEQKAFKIHGLEIGYDKVLLPKIL